MNALGAQLSTSPNLTIQVLRRDVPNTPVLGGNLITLDFGDTAPRITFSSVTYGPSTYHDQEEDTGPMFHALDRVRELALPPQESSDLLLSKLKDMR